MPVNKLKLNKHMKKLFLISIIGLAALKSAFALDTNAPMVFTTNTIVRVAPLQLTTEQMDALIAAVQGAGIQADALICATNIDVVRVVRTGADAFTVQINLRAK